MRHPRSDYNARVVDLAGLIPEDEPVFLLRGQDMFAVPAVRFWANQMRGTGEAGAEVLANSALRHANLMEAWRPKKLADVPEGVGLDGEAGDTEFQVGVLQAPDFYQPFDKQELEMLFQGIDEGTVLGSDHPLIAKLRVMWEEAPVVVPDEVDAYVVAAESPPTPTPEEEPSEG